MLEEGKYLEVVKADIETDLEWNEFVRNQYNLFYDWKFLKYNDVFNKNINWHHLKIKIKGTNKVFAIVTGCIDDEKKEYFSCKGVSFGGFLWKNKINLVEYLQLVNAFKKYLTVNGIKKCVMNLPPFFYQLSINEESEYALINSGFSLKNVSITNIVELKDFNISKLSSTVAKQVQKQPADVIYEMIEGELKEGDLFEFYSVLKKDRELKGAVPTHTREELIYLKNNLPQQIKFFQSKINGELASICVLFVVNKNIILNFYLAGNEKYKDVHAVKALMFHTIEWSAKNNYMYYDVGTSDVNGKLLEGLFKFKKHFSGNGFLRKNFEINL